MSRVIAIIGASRDRSKYGNKAVRAFLAQGYTVVPIHPREAVIEGLKAYASVLDAPVSIEMASMYVPPEIGEGVLDDLVRKHIREVWFNPGSETPALVARARSLGLEPIVACSIRGVGEDPDDF
jgi:uncharacterized protein